MQRLLFLLTLGFLAISLPTFANNGRPTDPTGTPYVEFQSLRLEKNRILKGRCSGTISFGTLDKPWPRTLLLSAAHCFVSRAAVNSIREENREQLDSIRSEIRERRWSVSELKSCVESGNPASENKPVCDVFRPLIRRLQKAVENGEGFQDRSVSFYPKTGRKTIGVEPNQVAVPAVYLASLLLQKSGLDGPFDIALVDVRIPSELPALRVAHSLESGDLTDLTLSGFGAQLDPILPLDEDFDGDGVINRLDECPYSKPGISVDAQGCAEADNRLSFSFRSGRHLGAPLRHSASWNEVFGDAGLNLSQAIDLNETQLTMASFSHTMPGKGDSGSALEIRQKSTEPSAIIGVYHGAIGPRPSRDYRSLSVTARYESLLSPIASEWIAHFPFPSQ